MKPHEFPEYKNNQFVAIRAVRGLCGIGVLLMKFWFPMILSANRVLNSQIVTCNNFICIKLIYILTNITLAAVKQYK